MRTGAFDGGGLVRVWQVFINCVTHEAVELPMYMGNVVDNDYYNNKGLEGLRVRTSPARGNHQLTSGDLSGVEIAGAAFLTLSR